MATTFKRVMLLLSMLLAVLMATPAYSHQQQQQQQQDAVFEAINNTTSLATAVSGCGLCQQTGQCDQAFRGTPCQFCQTLESAAPCCCPADAQCMLTNTRKCMCKRVDTSWGHYLRRGTDMTTDSEDSTFGYVLVALWLPCACYVDASTQYGTRGNNANSSVLTVGMVGTVAICAADMLFRANPDGDSGGSWGGGGGGSGGDS